MLNMARLLPYLEMKMPEITVSKRGGELDEKTCWALDKS